MEHHFQINLHGIIKLLSEHLYSNPDVYIRELLQNAVDAIRAREIQDSSLSGKIQIELLNHGGKPMLVFEDNGIGLSEPDVHEFLSVIGQSSKVEDIAGKRNDFIGQFGIGLLSCFMVSDEIEVISLSAKNTPAVRWRGRPDGKYDIETYREPLTTGTRVILTAKAGMEAFFTEDFLSETARKYGGLLPYPIMLASGGDPVHVNDSEPPWRQPLPPENSKHGYMEFGRLQLGEQVLDAIVLKSGAGGIEGAAYILPYAYKHSAKTTHRVYLKNMLLSEAAEDLLPGWAFFVKCIVNAENLRPTASRESFYEDEVMERSRRDMGECIRDYLVDLASNDPRQLQEILRVHNLAIKALALEDEEFFRLIIDYMPFETSMGRITLGEYKKHNETIRFVSGLDQYRQVAQVAFAHGMWLINGGYVYDSELMQMHARIYPERLVDEVDVTSLSHEFGDLDFHEREACGVFLQACDKTLHEYQCNPSVKKYLPSNIPALFIINESGNFLRSVEQSKMVSDSLWGAVLDNISMQMDSGLSQLCFNYENELVRRLLKFEDGELLRSCIKMLYVQSLLLGHHPLNAREMAILNTGLINIIEHSLRTQEMATCPPIDPKSIN